VCTDDSKAAERETTIDREKKKFLRNCMMKLCVNRGKKEMGKINVKQTEQLSTHDTSREINFFPARFSKTKT
jgi:hypothetical protein